MAKKKKTAYDDLRESLGLGNYSEKQIAQINNNSARQNFKGTAISPIKTNTQTTAQKILSGNNQIAPIAVDRQDILNKLKAQNEEKLKKQQEEQKIKELQSKTEEEKKKKGILTQEEINKKGKDNLLKNQFYTALDNKNKKTNAEEFNDLLKDNAKKQKEYNNTSKAYKELQEIYNKDRPQDISSQISKIGSKIGEFIVDNPTNDMGGSIGNLFNTIRIIKEKTKKGQKITPADVLLRGSSIYAITDRTRRQLQKQLDNVEDNETTLTLKQQQEELRKQLVAIKNKKSDKYNKLLRAYNETTDALQTEQANNLKKHSGVVGAVEKGGSALMGGLDSSIQGFESTIDKILGVSSDKEKGATRVLSDEAIRTTDNKIGKTALELTNSIGAMVPTMIAGLASGGASLAVSFGTYGGAAYNQAKQDGYSDKQATTYGIVNGTLEAALNKILPSFKIGGKNVYGKVATDKLTSKIMAKTIGNEALKRLIADASGEFTEEYLQEFLDPIVREAILEENNGVGIIKGKDVADIASNIAKYTAKNFFSEENLHAGLLGALSSGLMGAPSAVRSNAYTKATGRSAETGLTQNEQKVVDSIVENRKAELKEKNGKVTKKDISKIEQEVRQDLERGYIETNDIERALSNEEWAKHDNAVKQKESLQKELDELNSRTMDKITPPEYKRISELEEQIKNIDTNTTRNELNSAMNGKVTDNDTLLQNIYGEEIEKKNAYQFDKNEKLTEQTKKINEDIKKLGLNNNIKTRDAIDILKKVSNETGRQYRLVNNNSTEVQTEYKKIAEKIAKMDNISMEEALKQTENLLIDGFVSDGQVFINVESNNLMRAITGHETTHLFEGTEDYKKLQKIAFKYAETKGEYNSRRKSLEKRYRGIENAKIDNELTSDLVGDYLFSDIEFVRNLSTEQPNIFNKMYNYVKHLYNMATAGSKEARQLEQLKYNFEKVYRENNQSKASNDTKFSIQTDSKGNKYVNVDTDQDIFEGIDEKDYNKIAKMYINDYLKGKTILSESDTAIIDSKTAKKYTNPGKKQPNFSEKMRLTPELKNVLEISEKVGESSESKDNSKYKNWEYYRTIFKINNEMFEGLVNIGIDSKGNKHLYEVNNIKKTSGISETSPNRPTGFSRNNIPQNEQKVNSDISTKYSIQNKEKNTQELDNSSFSNEKKYSISEKTGELQDNKGNKVKIETSDVGNTGTLMAMHNLGENKLNGILDLGGIPVPSIAITNPEIVNHKQFGDGTLIFNKSTIDPAVKANEVYDRDVWTPTFPTIEYDLNIKVIDKARKAVGGYGNSYLSNANSFLNNIEDKVNRQGLESVIEDLKNSKDFKYIYYKSLNPNFELLTKQDSEDLNTDYSNELLEEFANEYGEIPHWSDATSEQREEIVDKFLDKLIPRLEERANKIIAEEQAKEKPRMFIIGMAKSTVENIKEKSGALGWQDTLLQNLNKIQNEGTTRTVNDYETTNNFIEENIDQKQYEKWIDELFNGLIAKKGIYNGKDYITSSGNRRTFNQLHEDYNLQNLVKILTSQKTVAGEQGFGAGTGFGTIQAQMNNQFESIEDIRNAENRIVENAKEITDQYRELIGNDMEQLGEYLKYKSEYSYLYDSAGTALNDFSGYKNLNMANLNKALENNNIDSKRVPLELKQKIIDDISSLKDLPTDYFEAKPQRAVGLDEIAMAVIPNNWSAETKQRLTDKGIKYTEYDPSIEGDRQRVINQYDNLKFMLSNRNDIAPISNNDIRARDMLLPRQQETQQEVEKIVAPIQEENKALKQEVETLKKEVKDIRENSAVTQEEFEQENRRIAPLLEEQEAPPEVEQVYDNLKDTTRMPKKELKMLSKNIKDALGLTNRQKLDLEEIIQNYSISETATREDLYNDIKKRYGKQAIITEYEDIRNVQTKVKSMKIDVSDNIKHSIADYNKLKQKNFGKLSFSRNGQPVDSVYQELSSEYPNYFPDNIYNETDQFQKIVEVANLENKSIEEYDIDDNYVRETSDYIYDSIMDSKQDALQKAIEKTTKESLQGDLKAPLPTVFDTSSIEADNAYDEVRLMEHKARKKQKVNKTSNVSRDSGLAPYIEFAREHNLTGNDEVIETLNEADAAEENKRIEAQKKIKPQSENSIRKALTYGQYLFTNRNVEIDNYAEETGNHNIKVLADHINNIQGEISTNINDAQTDNFGKTIGKSITQIFSQADKAGLSEPFNDYLFHLSNIERHKWGKGSQVPMVDSLVLTEKYEKAYPEMKSWAKEVNKYNKNLLYKQADAGLITKELADNLSDRYEFYVPFMENLEGEYTPDSSNTIKTRSTVKRAKGGADRNLLGFEEAMINQTSSAISQIRKNQLYQEIVKTVDNATIDFDTNTNPDINNSGLMSDGKKYYLTAYVDGKATQVEIDKSLYHGLAQEGNRRIRNAEQKLAPLTNPLQKASNIRRNILTTWSPSFLATNMLKDIQDAPLNSKYASDMIKNYPKALKEIATGKGEHVEAFLNMYGQGNLRGDYNLDSGLADATELVKSSSKNKGIEISKSVLKKIPQMNEVIELAPRYAEYLASLENGCSQMEALYNAREVTTNFGRGGIITKALNRNGFTFLNANVQGMSRLVRNFSGANGARGVVNSLTKVAALGIAPALFNALMYGSGDDEDKDYKALPDYIKDNYYLIKTSNNNFIRIPKGRMLSIFGSAARRTLELSQGEKDAFNGYISNAYNQVGVQNPIESNIFAPLIQAKNNKTWYGSDLVPSRLQDKPKDEQYDSSTDKFSIWLGQKTKISPYKINYVIDQYSGGIGDMILPTITEEAQSDTNSTLGTMIAPLKDKFTADSTTDNKYVSDFYTKNDEFKVKANSSKATDKDKLTNQYMKTISFEMGQLYGEMRKVQEDKKLSKSEKYRKAQNIKKEINKLAEEGLNGYNKVSKVGDYAEVGEREFYKWTNDEGETVWSKPKDEDLDKLNSLGLTIGEKSEYYKTRSKLFDVWDKYKDNYDKSKSEAIKAIRKSNMSDDAKYALYNASYNKDEEMNIAQEVGIEADAFLDYMAQTFKADKNRYGKSISGSKKAKILNYINSMNIEPEQRMILYKMQYKTNNYYNNAIVNYLNNSSLTYEEEEYILKKLGFKVSKNGNISW